MSWNGEIVGHRGAAGLAPENTRASCEAALEAGADRVELDVRVTADRRLAVFHDARLTRFSQAADADRAVMRRPLAELQALDVGAALGRPGCFVPALEDLLDAFSGRLLFNVEVKGSGAEGRLAMELTLRLVRERGLEDDLIVSSFHDSVLRSARGPIEGPELALLVKAESRRDPVELARQLGCRSLHVKAELASVELRGRCREAGLSFRAWTLNEESELQSFMTDDVDGIVTDRPDRLARLAGRQQGA